MKTILIINQHAGVINKIDPSCPVKKCKFASNRFAMEKADLVIFNNDMYIHDSMNPKSIGKKRPVNQIYMLYVMESPAHYQKVFKFSQGFNWTASYR